MSGSGKDGFLKPKPKWELLDSTYTKAEMIAIKTSLGDRSSVLCPHLGPRQ